MYIHSCDGVGMVVHVLLMAISALGRTLTI